MRAHTTDSASMRCACQIALLIVSVCTSLLLFKVQAAEPSLQVESPDGNIRVDVQLDTIGVAHYSVAYKDATVLEPSRLGLKRDDADFSRGLSVAMSSNVDRIDERYELLTSKRRNSHYVANRKTFHFETADGKKLDVIFQVSNDGLAFRYVFPEQSTQIHKLSEEATSFRFAPQTRAWLQPIATAKTPSHCSCHRVCPVC